MNDLSLIARATLTKAHGAIDDPTGFPGGVWNSGELAWVRCYVTNTTGVLLREVVAELRVTGAARVNPINFGFGMLDGDWYWPEIEPGEAKSFYVPVFATAAGSATLRLSLCAELVPYACVALDAHHANTSPA